MFFEQEENPMSTNQTKLKLFGQEDPHLKEPGEIYRGGERNVKIRDAVKIESKRSGDVNEFVIEGLADDDVLELTFENGYQRWMTVAEIRDEFGIRPTRGGDPNELLLPQQLPGEETTRGVTSWVLKGLRVLDFDPSEKTIEEATKKIDNERIMPNPGLYRFSHGLDKKGTPVSNEDLPTDEPILVFLHGTFSSTNGSFGKLDKGVWEKVRRQYGENIFGLDHRTLSVTPIQNALDLVQILPQEAHLHLVSHSRGGLVGELLCRSKREDGKTPFDDGDLKIDHTEEEKELLKKLSEELNDKNIRVERFVRVAGAAGGTTLASGRIDKWLEILVNVIGKVTGASATIAYGVITDILLDLKKQSANPDAMPGVACLLPTSPMVRMLNRPEITVDADLSVIAGDTQGKGVLQSLGIALTNLFFLEDHDLVVHTRSMYGGMPRTEEARYFFYPSADINHFKYFENKETAGRIQEALLNDFDQLDKFKPISEARRSKSAPRGELTERSYQKRSGILQPVVYVVPGIMGSHLAADGDRIWLNILELAVGGMANLQISAPNIKPVAPMASGYARLIDYLSATHEVIPFPYDWRKSILEAAQRLGDELAQKFKETDQPIRIVAHSMGGLVTRAMFELCPDVWTEFKNRDGCRLLLLGTPHQGSYAIARLLMGQERTLKFLELLDLRHSRKDILQWILQYPGVLELLPSDDVETDYFSVQLWDELHQLAGEKLPLPQKDDLENAKDFSNTLMRSPVDSEKMAYVAGWAPNTPCGIRKTDDHGKIDVHFVGTDEGDGRVPWSTGIPEGVPTWYMEAVHGDLANHAEDFPALYELLVTGQTQRLPQTPQHASRAGRREYRLADETLEIFPDQIDLEQAVLYAAPTRLEVPKVAPIHVSVAHGNLAFCERPVAVGHYEGDTLVSAEKALDYYLDGRLTTHYELGDYPGEIGSALVVLNPEEKPGGAIVVGLGKVGELSPKKLTTTFVTALTKYAIEQIEQNPETAQTEIEFTSLLVGTGEGGLSIFNCISAILKSAFLVNQALAQLQASNGARITNVQFIELYKDRAIEAARDLLNYPDQQRFDIGKELINLAGGQHRAYFQPSPGWWNRMQVRKGRGRSLVFSIPTNRARSEESELTVQWHNINKLIQQAVNYPNWDWRLATTMFELMLPNRVKAFVSDLSNMVLVVDDSSARYPWELIYDRRVGDQKPMVVDVGLIRQLSTPVFRTQVMDASNRNVLVVGNPANTPNEFVDLPGAEQEAQIVARLFEGDEFTVTRQIHTDTADIMTNMFSEDYRILHLAGHGVFNHQLDEDVDQDGENDKITGMVLGGGAFLTAVEIDQMIQIPELVFINCCFLGNLDPEDENFDKKRKAMQFPRHEFAASLSQKLIEMGVKAVVAAGWAVDDAAAVTFAETFYHAMLAGEFFGEAVKKARSETYTLHHKRTNTWGAYQCYGDPAYKLSKKVNGPARKDDHHFVDFEEAIVEIDNLIEDAKTTSVQGLGNLKDRLERTIKDIEKINASWLADPRMNESLGRAFGEIDQFEKAINHYETALRHKAAKATIKAAEQQANLRARWAIEVNNTGYQKQAQELIDESLNQLENLNAAFGESLERLAMIGSAYKRLAQISKGKARQTALENMQRKYEEARQFNPKITYPLTNRLTAQAVLYWIGAELRRPRDQDQEIESMMALAKNQTIDQPHDFWAAIGETDAFLAKYIFENVLATPNSENLVYHYASAWKRYGSPRELSSVFEQFDFLIEMFAPQEFDFKHDSPHRKQTRTVFYNELRKIAGELKESIGD